MAFVEMNSMYVVGRYAAWTLSILFWIALVIYVLAASLPYNPARSGLVSKKELRFSRAILPEGFGFFTRNAREPYLLVYKKTGGEVECVSVHNSSYHNLFGLLRKSRALYLEVGSVFATLQDSLWTRTVGIPGNIFFNQYELPLYTVRNMTPKAILCGEYFLQQVEPVPWAWAGTFDENRSGMPSEVIRLNVICD